MEDNSDETNTTSITRDDTTKPSDARPAGRRIRLRTAVVGATVAAAAVGLVAAGVTAAIHRGEGTSITSPAMTTVPSPPRTANTEPRGFEEVDVDAWRKDLHGAGVRSSPDMTVLYKQAVKDCTAQVADLTRSFSTDNVRPDRVRIGMKYVCPSRISAVDDALTQVQESNASLETACNTPPSLRTEKQQELVAEKAAEYCE